MSIGLKFRQEVGRLGQALIDELDNITSYISKAGFIIGQDVYYALAASTTIQSVPNATWTVLSLASLDDPLSLVSGSGIRIPVAGLYQVSAVIGWTISGAGNTRRGAIYANGNFRQFVASPPVPATYGTRLSLSYPIRCGVGDIVNLYGFQDSGGALNSDHTVGFPESYNHLSVRWIRP